MTNQSTFILSDLPYLSLAPSLASVKYIPTHHYLESSSSEASLVVHSLIFEAWSIAISSSMRKSSSLKPHSTKDLQLLPSQNQLSLSGLNSS